MGDSNVVIAIGGKIGHKRLRDYEGGDKEERNAIEGVESTYEAAKDRGG